MVLYYSHTIFVFFGGGLIILILYYMYSGSKGRLKKSHSQTRTLNPTPREPKGDNMLVALSNEVGFNQEPSGFRGLGFGVSGLGFRVWGLGFGVQRFRV